MYENLKFVTYFRNGVQYFQLFIFLFLFMETNKLFVWNISWGIDWKQLKDIFGEFGEVSFVRIVSDRETGKSRGFGFVEFTSVDDAIKAKDSMDGKELDGRELKIDFAQEKKED